MLCDYHIHTVLCKHAEGTAEAYLAEARRKGIGEVCFTDHVPAPDGYDPANRMELSQVPLYRRLVEAARASSASPAVLLGIEADFYDGCEPFLREWLPAQPFDMVLGSVHFIRDWGFDNPESRAVWDSVDLAQTWGEYFKIVERLARSRLFDVVGHLDLPKKFGHRPLEPDIRRVVSPALDAIAAAGMSIELNTSGLRRQAREIYPSPLILSLARERNIPITFGSDAHTPGDVGHEFPAALALALDAGYTHHARYQGRSRTLEPLFS